MKNINNFNPFELVFSNNKVSIETLYSKLVTNFNKNTSFPFDELLVKVAFTFLCNDYLNQMQKTEKKVSLTELYSNLDFDKNTDYYTNLLDSIYRDWEPVSKIEEGMSSGESIMIQLIDLYKVFWGEELYTKHELEELSNLFYTYISNSDFTKISSDEYFHSVYFIENM